MRIFTSVSDAMNEMARDLYEMGVERHTKTMQDRNIVDDYNFYTKELTNVSFAITRPIDGLDEIFILPEQGKYKEWADSEFNERIDVKHINPGVAWMLRPDLWSEFLLRNKGRFSYTYNERIRVQLERIVEILKIDIMTRQAILAIWNPIVDVPKIGIDRVPCSLYYHFMANGNNDIVELDMVYAMRSCDFINHMPNDVYLAIRLLEFVCDTIGANLGKFFMNVSSLHYYKKDEHVLDKFMCGKIGGTNG